MTDNIDSTLRECHRIVWQYRQELEPYWPTPSTEDALLFAFTELGEAVDAHLRSKPEYARNRDKDLSVLDELADVCLMLVTALGPHRRIIVLDDRLINEFGERGWRDLASDFGDALSWYGDPEASEVWIENIVIIIERIVSYPGMDLPTRLTARLERIKAKRMPSGVPDAYDQVLLRHDGCHQ